MRPLAILATHPIQYQVPFYRFLTKRGFPIHVFFLCDRGLEGRWDPGFGQPVAWDVPLLEGYPYEFLPNLRREGIPEDFFGLVNPSVIRRLSRRRFGALLVHGYRSLSMLGAVALSTARRIPVLYRSDSTLLDRRPFGAKRRLGRLLMHSVSACLTTGTENKLFYRALGVPEMRLFLVPHAVDNERFAQDSASISREHARDSLRLPAGETVVLFVGKLISQKRPELLLRAFAAASAPNAHLAFVGDGEMRTPLAQEASRIAPGRVSFLGFQNQGEIGLAYKSADLLVLPSSVERWGLVVNEAMNFGLPVILSDRVGCGRDLVTPGTEGLIFHEGDQASLSHHLRAMLSKERNLTEMGRAAKERIAHWGFEEAAEGLEKAMAFVEG